MLAALGGGPRRRAPTVAVVNNAAQPGGRLADVAVELLTGPEVLAGSTRLKAGTAQKVVLNVISTERDGPAGKSYGAWMVDVQATNEKLAPRGRRRDPPRGSPGSTTTTAAAALEAAGWHTKTATRRDPGLGHVPSAARHSRSEPEAA